MTASGIIDFDNLDNLLEYPPKVQRSFSLDLNELTIKLLRGILDNLVTTIWFYFSEDIEVFLEFSKFVNALLQLYNFNDDKRQVIFNNIKNHFSENKSTYLEKYIPKAVMLISKQFLREIYWLHEISVSKNFIKKNYSLNTFIHWIMSRSSFGRIGLTPTYLKNKIKFEKVKVIYDYILTNVDMLMEKIITEAKYVKDLQKQLRKSTGDTNG